MSNKDVSKLNSRKMNSLRGSWQSRKHRNLSPYLDKCLGACLSVWCNYFGTLESVECRQLPVEGLDSKLQLILIILSSQYSNVYPCSIPAHVRQLCMCSWSSTHTTCRSPLKTTGFIGEIRKWRHMSKERPRKDIRRPNFTPQADPQHRNSI